MLRVFKPTAAPRWPATRPSIKFLYEVTFTPQSVGTKQEFVAIDERRDFQGDAPRKKSKSTGCIIPHL